MTTARVGHFKVQAPGAARNMEPVFAKVVVGRSDDKLIAPADAGGYAKSSVRRDLRKAPCPKRSSNHTERLAPRGSEKPRKERYVCFEVNIIAKATPPVKIANRAGVLTGSRFFPNVAFRDWRVNEGRLLAEEFRPPTGPTSGECLSRR